MTYANRNDVDPCDELCGLPMLYSVDALDAGPYIEVGASREAYEVWAVQPVNQDYWEPSWRAWQAGVEWCRKLTNDQQCYWEPSWRAWQAGVEWCRKLTKDQQ